MELTLPVIITPRLLPGVQIDNSYISVDYKTIGMQDDSRVYYRYWLDLELDGKCIVEYGDELSTGCNHGLGHALSDLIAFMAAGGNGQLESEDLFSPEVQEWLLANAAELSILSIVLEESEGLIRE